VAKALSSEPLSEGWFGPQWLADTGPVIDLASPFSAVVQVTVSGSPGGDVRFHRIYEAGRVAQGGPGPVKNPDVALTLPLTDAHEVLDGRLDPSVAFMQGRLKTAGDNGLLLRLLAGWSSPPGQASLAQVRAVGEDPKVDTGAHPTRRAAPKKAT
jgi:SCP-2 sterol transfer family